MQKSYFSRFHFETAVVFLVAAFLSGCGTGAPYDIVPVSSKVMYDDGTPIPAPQVVVVFESETPRKSPAEHSRAGHAMAKPHGTFSSITTWKSNDF